jgi:hypothetical protein
MAKRLCDVCVRPVNKSFLKRSHKVIVALTVQEIFEDHIAKKRVWRQPEHFGVNHYTACAQKWLTFISRLHKIHLFGS